MRDLRFLLLGLVMLVLSGCTNDSDEVSGGDKPTTQDDFIVAITAVTRSTATLDVTPSESIGDYLCVVEERERVDEFTRDSFVIETILQELGEEASNGGKTLEEYMPEVVERGRLEGAQFSGLKIDTDYYVLLFGVDAERGYTVSSELTKVAFKTAAVEQSDAMFEVATEVTDNSVAISVTPSDSDIYWYLCTMTKEQYDYYVTSDDGYKMSEGYFYEYYFQQEINTLLGQGYSEQQVLDTLIHRGALELEAKGLQEHTDYYALVAGLVVDSEGIVVVTDVTRAEYRTEAAAQSTMTFEIEVWDIGQMEASFSITPSNDKDKYCALVAPWDGVSTADEQMHKLVEQWGGWMDLMSNDRGKVEHSGANRFKLPAADTDYYIIAFGYDGGITTEAAMKTFRTLPGGSLEEVEFTVSATNLSPYGFTMNITSSDPTIYYVPGACVEGEYNETEFIALEEEVFDYYYTGSKDFNAGITVCEVLDQYYYNGSCSVKVSGLLPDTEIMAYIFALDVRTGKVAKTYTFDSVARTSTLGVANPTIELVGYFSGDEEAGALFGDAAATRGKAITVVKYNDLDNVRTLFTTMVEGDCSNTMAYPDNELWSVADGYWNTCKTSSPYTFYLADWNLGQTALAYATDNTGKAGAIARLYTMPTSENRGDIEVLKELVEELNSTTRASLVVGVVGD